MMQPTPAPTSAPSSPPPPESNEEEETYPPQPRTFGSAPFYVLANLFEKLGEERKHEKRRKMLETWFSHWRSEIGRDLYPVLRLLLPQKDRERAHYGLKEKNLAKTYIKLIPLGMRDPDALRMLNWKKPMEKDQVSGDFSAVLYEVVSARSSVIEGSLSIHDLNDILDELSKNIGKQDVQSKILQKVYNRSTPEEQRWIVRIILKDMNISIRETTIFSVFHPDAQDLFNSCSDLKKVAWELWDPNYRLNEEDTTVRLFSAFAPMLCKRPTKNIEETVKEMQGVEFIIEEKLDGERMQLHKRGNEFFYCSRKGKDYTYLYGKHIGEGSLTPFINGAFDKRIKSIILDGEMLVWDPVSARHLPFGTLKTAALDKARKASSPRPCFKIFDLLYLNGEPLLKRSTKFRKKNMRAYIKPISGRLEFTDEYKGRTAKDIRERMEQVMEQKGEGLVVKHPMSEYVLNGRNKDWIKVKPEYMDNMGETVDLLVVGGCFGSKRRGSGVSTLVCAVLDDRAKDEDEEPKYSTFVRIGSGFTYADYLWIRSKPWKTWVPGRTPAFLNVHPKSTEDKGDMYLEPEDSFIVKVKAAEVIVTTRFHLGLTMRFPRAISVRDDLTAADCMTATSIWQTIRTVQKRKMNDELADKKKPIKKRKVVAKPQILPQYRGVQLKNIPVETDLFDGMQFKVESDPKSRTGDQDKQDLVRLIHINGGTIVQIAKPELRNFFIIYDGKITPLDIQLLIQKDIYDILKPSWIHDSVKNGKVMPFKKSYFFSTTSARCQGDDFGEEGEVEQPQAEDKPNTQDQIKESSSDESKLPKKDEDKSTASTSNWFAKEEGEKNDDGDESVTESETDYDSAREERGGNVAAALSTAGGGGGKVELDDEWIDAGVDGEEDEDEEDVKSEEEEDTQTLRFDEPEPEGSTKKEEEDIKMGEDDEATEYDTEKIFRHLVFYLDTPSNARTQNMQVSGKPSEQSIEQSFSSIEQNLISDGGKVTSCLSSPKLTHVIMDGRDLIRRRELMKRTCEPKRRYLVLSEWVGACLDEETLLDEDVFAP